VIVDAWGRLVGCLDSNRDLENQDCCDISRSTATWSVWAGVRPRAGSQLLNLTLTSSVSFSLVPFPPSLLFSAGQMGWSLTCLHSHYFSLFLLSLYLLPSAYAQFPLPVNLTTRSAPNLGRVHYTDASGLCGNSKSYSGIIDVADNMHMSFWFFEAQNNPSSAPLTLAFNGGPGAVSILMAVLPNGPCKVNNDGSTTTATPDTSFNKYSNIIYIDNPNLVGASYDTLVRGYYSPYTGQVTPVNTSASLNASTPGGLLGTWAVGTASSSPSLSVTAAQPLWFALQSFLGSFPKYAPSSDAGFFISSTSYGGHYAPALASYILKQNNGTSFLKLPFKGMHLIAPSFDLQLEYGSYPSFASNNTYGIQLADKGTIDAATKAYSGAGGCFQQTSEACKYLAGNNTACFEADDYCFTNVQTPLMSSNYSIYDIRISADEYDTQSISPLLVQFFNMQNVQQKLGLQRNITLQTIVVTQNFISAGDYSRNFAPLVASILDAGIQVTIVSGDADFTCNWIGTERVLSTLQWRGAQKLSKRVVHPFGGSLIARKHLKARQAPTSSFVDFTYNGAVAGFGYEHLNLAWVVMAGAGHTVARQRPNEVLQTFLSTLRLSRVIGAPDLSSSSVLSSTSPTTLSSRLTASSSMTVPVVSKSLATESSGMSVSTISSNSISSGLMSSSATSTSISLPAMHSPGDSFTFTSAPPSESPQQAPTSSPSTTSVIHGIHVRPGVECITVGGTTVCTDGTTVIFDPTNIVLHKGISIVICSDGSCTVCPRGNCWACTDSTCATWVVKCKSDTSCIATRNVARVSSFHGSTATPTQTVASKSSTGLYCFNGVCGHRLPDRPTLRPQDSSVLTAWPTYANVGGYVQISTSYANGYNPTPAQHASVTSPPVSFMPSMTDPLTHTAVFSTSFFSTYSSFFTSSYYVNTTSVSYRNSSLASTTSFNGITQSSTEPNRSVSRTISLGSVGTHGFSQNRQTAEGARIDSKVTMWVMMFCFIAGGIGMFL